MKTEFKDSFLKDIRSIKDKKILSRLEQFILVVESVDSLSQIPNLKKLKGQKNKVYFRSIISDYLVESTAE